jgi:hypothetical protein
MAVNNKGVMMMGWIKLFSLVMAVVVAVACSGKKQNHPPPDHAATLVAIPTSDGKFALIKAESVQDAWQCVPNKACAAAPPCRCPNPGCSLCRPLEDFVIGEELATGLDDLIKKSGVKSIVVLDPAMKSRPGSGSSEGSAVK